MITVNKKDIGNWLLVEYLADLHVVREKIRFFEKKYRQSWNAFETGIITSTTEDFARWDDYMEWKAYMKMNDALSQKINPTAFKPVAC